MYVLSMLIYADDILLKSCVNFLIFIQLISKHQSVGGMSNTTPPSVATTVLKNVKKGISALSELH